MTTQLREGIVIKLRLRREGTVGPFIIIGLSEDNLDKLRGGYPISFPLADLGMGDGRIMLMAGKDERAMVDELEREGIPIGGAETHAAIDELEARAKKRRS